MSINAEQGSCRHILNELGFAIKRVGNELHGAASIPLAPRVPVTLELDVHLYRPAPGSGTVRGVDRTIKTGRSSSPGRV